MRLGDMTVPSKMAWTFIYLHSILNGKLFLNTLKTTADMRMSEFLKLHRSNPYAFAPRYYPRAFPLTLDIYEEEPLPGDFIENGEEGEEEEALKIAVLPRNLPLTKSSFGETGVFLVDSG